MPPHQVCFDDAFDTAAATLKDRAAAHGAASPEVKAWLAAQDAVFANCHESTPSAGPADRRPALAAGRPRLPDRRGRLV